MTTLPLVALLLFGQYFGKNKIQYEDHDFEVIESEHFRIYFHTGGDDLAAFAEEVLEDGYLQLSEDLGIEVEFQIPVVLYNSPNDFAQTNITLDLIEEAVGGFTELMKNRMVMGEYPLSSNSCSPEKNCSRLIAFPRDFPIFCPFRVIILLCIQNRTDSFP